MSSITPGYIATSTSQSIQDRLLTQRRIRNNDSKPSTKLPQIDSAPLLPCRHSMLLFFAFTPESLPLRFSLLPAKPSSQLTPQDHVLNRLPSPIKLCFSLSSAVWSDVWASFDLLPPRHCEMSHDSITATKAVRRLDRRLTNVIVPSLPVRARIGSAR